MLALSKGHFKHAEHTRKELMCALSIQYASGTDASTAPTRQELM